MTWDHGDNECSDNFYPCEYGFSEADGRTGVDVLPLVRRRFVYLPSPSAQFLLQDELVLRPKASSDSVQVRRVVPVFRHAVLYLPPQPLVQDQRWRAHEVRNSGSYHSEQSMIGW